MSVSIIFIIVTLIDTSNTQWTSRYSNLYRDVKFTELNSADYLIFQDKSANFITCTTPPISYFTLNSTYPSAYDYIASYNNNTFFSVDLYFQGTWTSQIVNITVYQFSYLYNYTSPTNYSMQTGFCDDIAYEVRTINFLIQQNITQDYLNFKSLNTNDGQVSIRNIYISQLVCYPSCKQCTGPKSNQCTSCYYGLPTNNICPPCPSNQYYEKFFGCRDICSIYSPLYSNGFCQSFPSYSQSFISEYNTQFLFNIYDPLYVDTSPNLISYYYNIYGVFKFNSGISRFIQTLFAYSNSLYQCGFNIRITTFNDIPLDCGIQFLINNTYIGSIYRNGSGIQTHKMKIYSITSQSTYLNYTLNKYYSLITYVDLPKSPFIFSAKGNYSDNTAGWGFSYLTITSGYCPIYCEFCEVSFKCKTCQRGYYLYMDNTCIGSCSQPYQKLNGSYCLNFQKETPYSEYLSEDFINFAHDPEQYQEYKLISQNGTNFLKGLDIFYSNLYWANLLQKRIFGGPLIWAQAKFQRTHNVDDPHHSITIAFYILFGPEFPSDGQFIYTIENNPSVSLSTQNFNNSYSNGVKWGKVYERINHNTSTLIINWECFGPNNEPVKAYCGFYNYYIVVHKCQPYCLECSNETTCLQWNSDYDENIVKFSQEECQNNYYFDKDSYRCLNCPQSCLTCTSKIDCQTCQSTYIQTKLGCVCKLNQYEDSNQCFDCPIECNQCLSSTNCIECLITNNRQLKNQQCVCIDGYYPVQSNPQCKKCHLFCKTCKGPTSDDCLTCNNIVNIENVGTICRCQPGSFYQAQINSCSQCHSSCKTCFQGTDNSCITCDSTLNRILKGLKCSCAPGYHELNSMCTNCPDLEDVLLPSCYKLCINNQYLWHTNVCNSCNTGFELISGECQPICGDLQILGYEQCEDNNTILDDLCYNCQFQCPIHCLTCDESTHIPCPDVCGDGLITGMEECEDGNNIEYDGCFDCKYQCQPQCTKCIKGECFECNTGGWQVDTAVQPWICQERCGDQIVVGSEQCDDGNTSDTDGCKDCKYFCRIGCSSCDYTTNTCLSCELPGFVPEKYYCRNICGDGLIVTDPYGFYSEQCEDANKVNNDGCNNQCKFQCQPSSICKSCIDNRCEECAQGYLLSNQKICISICGDQIKVPDEQCEDGLILPYKGCQNCKAKCQSSCINCDNKGLGCLDCKTGYQTIDNQCYSICGDQIITEDEECDDGNLIFGDGCHQCSFSCPISCSNCYKGVCHDCQEGYQFFKYACFEIYDSYRDPRCNSECLNCSKPSSLFNDNTSQGCQVCKNGFLNIKNTCYPICGDKLIVADEECDDGNLIFEDGCHACSQICPSTCQKCLEGFCQSCLEDQFLYKNQCFNLQENPNLKESTNFQFSALKITQSFKAISVETSQIQIKIFEFHQQVYDQVGYKVEVIDESFQYVSIEINIQCQKNKKVRSQFINSNYKKGNLNREKIIFYQCHQRVDHLIVYSFKLNKIVLKDEIILIQIFKDELKLSALFEQSPLKLLQIRFVDV
ncbi:unnamed protein product [Paramecium sonneborni]|uniref:EGF-like domain-containing protein n=1 Tax=Paramecium sonneborni TaxID=65129 RepID=A0A8S1RQ44_9CILI|nr:unnamed protein product [Paramecium sonneborni]